MSAHSPIWKRLAHSLISLAVALTMFSPLLSAPKPVSAAGPYVVDTSTDGPDSNLFDGSCSDGVDGCSLRAAIQQATHDGNPTTITFGSGLAGSTLLLDDTLTTGTILWIGDNITVTGESRNITISGVNLGVGKSIFKIEGSHNLLENLAVRQAPQDGIQVGDFEGLGTGNNNTIAQVKVISSGDAGIYVLGGSNNGGKNNTIQDSTIGSLTLAGCGSGNTIGVLIDQAVHTVLTSNSVVCNSGNGVQVSQSDNTDLFYNGIGAFNALALANGAHGVYISDSSITLLRGNLISGNAFNGITLMNSTQSLVAGNLIGLNEAGNTAIPNGGDGVALTFGSNTDTIGGMVPGDRNIISGNAGSGVLLDGTNTQTNTVSGNYIGTNVTGTLALANGNNGIRLQFSAHNNTIGGHGLAALGNVISGNSLDGVLFQDGAVLNYVDGNYIGLTANGLNALPNQLAGVDAVNSPNNSIGGGYTNTSQYISGNGGQGVTIGNSDNTYVGESNSIGVAADHATPRGNGLQGVLVNETINSTIVPFAVVYNGGSGVALTGVDSQNDKIAPTWVSNNGGLPVDLGEDGPTANDPGDGDGGPNTLLNYPVITSYAGSVITGTACANCTVLIYVVHDNPAAAGGGGFEIDSASANGAGQWTKLLVGGLHHLDVSLVACVSTCGLTSNTSEMSPRPILFLPIIWR